jgi:predicted HTH domain antitoxin
MGSEKTHRQIQSDVQPLIEQLHRGLIAFLEEVSEDMKSPRSNPMQITLDLPNELVQHFNRDRLPRQILENLVVQAYKDEYITSAEVGRLLNLTSRWSVESFLKEHKADLHYDEADLERDRATLHQLRTKPSPRA